jgi:hypothetical protein
MGSMTTISGGGTRDPRTMTADERTDEVASILASGVAQAVRGVASPDGAPTTCLDLFGSSSRVVA